MYMHLLEALAQKGTVYEIHPTDSRTQRSSFEFERETANIYQIGEKRMEE